MHTANPLPPMPMPADKWAAVVTQLGFSNQQARVAELVIRGLCDKEIAAELGIRVGTVRIYLTRLFAKTKTENRLGLVIKLFGIAMSIEGGASP